MPPLATALVRTGLALKINQAKRATASYLRDRSEQAQGIAVSYAVAAGLFAAAGIFLIAALLVGATALFRWVEIQYGLFPAFGAMGGLLLLLAIVFAVIASSRLKRPAREFPSLGSRLRVAVSASPAQQNAVPRSQAAEFRPARPPRASGLASEGGPAKAGLLLAATLAGWAFARRRQIAKQTAAPRRPGNASA